MGNTLMRNKTIKRDKSMKQKIQFFITICFSFNTMANTQPKKQHFNLGSSYFVTGIGAFDILRGESSPQAQIELWGNSNDLNLRPVFGAMLTDKISAYVYSGILWDFFLEKNQNFILNLGFTPGVYYQGQGKNLGFPIEFKSTIGFAYQIKDSSNRFGLQFYHISNASIGQINPGEESLVFYYAVAI
jgi:lipid A 3-O-deacylase